MANRYFIASGATANWNDVNSWSETSGGAVGASIPTSTDNAIFDVNSLSAPCNLTINAEANCADLDFSGLDNLLTLTNSAYNLNVYGNLTLTANDFLATAFTGTGYLQLRATTSVNITSNGCTRGWNWVYFDGAGGTWTNQDDWTTTTLLFTNNGTLNTNSKNISANSMNRGFGVFTYIFGSSIITLESTWLNQYASTIDAGTSTIIAKTAFYSVGSATYYNVIVNSSSASPNWFNGNATFNNLTINGVNGVTAGINFTNHSIVINGVLTLNGFNNNTSRMLVYSNTLGTPRTITVNGSIVASNVDFRDITLAGTANRDLSAIAGGSGDCGGNSGITFTPAANQYFKHSGSAAVNWSDTTKWFTTSGGSTAGRVPLPQDDAIFDANSFDANCTLNVNVPRIGGLNMEGVDQSVTFNLANGIEVYKSYILGNTITHTGYATLFMFGRGDYLLKLYQKTIYAVVINVIGSNKVTNMSSFSASNAGDGINVISGVFDLNDFDVNLAGGISTQVGSTLYFGSGTAYLNKATGTNLGIHVDSTIFSEQSLIVLNPTSGSSNLTFAGGGKVFNKIKFSGNHTGSFKIIGNNTMAELIIDAGRKVQFTNGTTQTIGKLTSNGTPDNKVTIQSTTAGSQATINYTGLDTPFIPNVVLKDINFSVPVYALNGDNLGNNTNVKYVWNVAKKTMGFPIRLVKD